ncbi:DNA modification methylase M.NGOI [Neisseria gonorrhoeae]|uniref:DNA modification methylase M.NGOI n=1 Tax=Neisseria gonorrhoeae TaxID=485 RepID=A0A378VXV7_NEIGO|nr:DNA modification methylase M.NGOI [Neisseria gonorrhoeae]
MFQGEGYDGIDLLAGGVPCPPFSKAGKQLGKDDERDLFPEAIRLAKETDPKAIMLEMCGGYLTQNLKIIATILQNNLPSWVTLDNGNYFMLPITEYRNSDPGFICCVEKRIHQFFQMA